MANDPGSWRLKPPHDVNAQGLIVSPFSYLEAAHAYLLDTSGALGSGWLKSLRAVLAITDANGKDVDPVTGKPNGCAALAFTAGGLSNLGVSTEILGQFAQPFIDGMHEPARRKRLADDQLAPPGRTQPFWGDSGGACEHPVHAALLLYHETPGQLEVYGAPGLAALAASGVKIAHELRLSLKTDMSVHPPVVRENFGFADGISQPVPCGDAIVTKKGQAYPRNPLHSIAAGDLMIGHVNAHGEPAPGPDLLANAPGATLLPVSPVDATKRSLGLDGSYLVMRELSQDVDAFWTSMQSAAKSLKGRDATWVAERVVGRDINGVILAENPPPGDDEDGPGNDFRFWDDDRDGLHCPLGSHIRRANPRDGLAPTVGTKATLLHAVNNHRILRRGRKYEAYAVPGAGEQPGLLFLCLNTDLERQFEFIQQTWLLNPSFASLFNERDPLLGPAGPFTVQAEPLRLRPAIDTFIRFVGGEYFYLPSISALAYLSELASP
ncbi:MAG TPA: hypothetical protein VMB71_02595 [Acetobacteraceae bacterium]|nr:hypothetical protein [Acetobacteraceae bacterium]